MTEVKENEVPQINCCICRDDTRAYVILDCTHKIGIVCFLTMIKNRDYRCPICRTTFAEIEDSDDDDEEDEEQISFNQFALDGLRERVSHIEFDTDLLEKIMDSNLTTNIIAGLFFILILIINRF